MKVAHNLLRAHGTATKVLRSTDPALNVGITLNLVPIEPATPAAAQAAERIWRSEYAFFLDAVLKGEYPKIVLKEMERTGATIETGDMELISQPLDYLGVNWYLRLVVNRRGRYVTIPAAHHTQVGWEIYPEAFTRMLVRMQEEYTLPRIYITENGTALDDKLSDGSIRDVGRTAYIHSHLNALENAAAQGVDLGGYFAWSLLDNLEWGGGFKFTFGIVHVDFKTLKRTIKDSGHWYRAVIATNKSRADEHEHRRSRRPRSWTFGVP